MKELLKSWAAALGGNALSNLLSALVILAAGILLIRGLVKVAKKTLERSKMEKAAHSLILSMLQVLLYGLLALSVASSLGIDVTGVVALFSVLTLALSLALQNMVSNVIGGFTILTTHPFHSGDYVEIGDQAGTVREITMTYTELITPDNKLIFIPNSTAVAAQIVNYSAMGCRRMELNITASYDDPTEKVRLALLEAARDDRTFSDPAPFAAVASYGDSAIGYTLRLWAKNEDYWDLYFDTMRRVKEIFDEQGITMTYPHLNVHIDK